MGTQLPLPSKGHSPQFSAHICCGQMVGCIEMPLGTKVGHGPGHIVLQKRNTPQFPTHVYCGQTVAHLSYCWALVSNMSRKFIRPTCFSNPNIIFLLQSANTKQSLTLPHLKCMCLTLQTFHLHNHNNFITQRTVDGDQYVHFSRMFTIYKVFST